MLQKTKWIKAPGNTGQFHISFYPKPHRSVGCFHSLGFRPGCCLSPVLLSLHRTLFWQKSDTEKQAAPAFVFVKCVLMKGWFCSVYYGRSWKRVMCNDRWEQRKLQTTLAVHLEPIGVFLEGQRSPWQLWAGLTRLQTTTGEEKVVLLQQFCNVLCVWFFKPKFRPVSSAFIVWKGNKLNCEMSPPFPFH